MADARSEMGFGVITPLSPRPQGPVTAPRSRRRPTGEPPPLPRELGRAGRGWAWLTAAVLLVWVLVAVAGLGRQIDALDGWVLRHIVALRTHAVTAVAKRLQALGSPHAIVVMRWVILAVALTFRRFRHIAVFLGCVLVSTALAVAIAGIFLRPRPVGVEILGTWSGYAHPSRPIVDVAVTLVGLTYMLAPRGPWRNAAKAATAGYIAALAAARLYLGVEYPTDTLIGVVLGFAITLVAFRALVPTEVFPVTYRPGRAAHLDVGGRRGEAVVRGLCEQLGLTVVAVAPFGLDGSSGSTPLRITLADGSSLFGKLYARNHLRADRWYKLFRTLVYGRLEDESTFSTVRRLVQYEDYLLRIARDAGLPTARPYGFAEITPEREYVLVTEFLDGAAEISDVKVDDSVIDDGLRLVRQLWDAGLAHRDIKPANVLVRDGKVLLIDLAFAELRPSPWRQAVDLANMLLVLALRSDPERVYGRAVRVFSPDEVAEAFAATRGIALTSQLRARLRLDGRDLISRFRQLAPPRTPIPIQRWSIRRIGLTATVLGSVLVALDLMLVTLSGRTLI